MKRNSISSKRGFVQRFFLALVLAMVSFMSFAQETKSVDVDVSTGKDNFWASPWVWVVGGAVFILLLVALMRGGGSRRDA